MSSPLALLQNLQRPSLFRSTVVVRRRHHRSHPTAVQPSLHFPNNALKYWDNFYRRHQGKFFKDRHYLEKDWGQYFCGDNGSSNGKKVVLEVGCGAGNTIFPLLASFPDLYIHACDLSPQAIKLVKSRADYKETQISAFVCDVTEEDLCDRLGPSSVDIVTLIFMLSAVLPSEMPKILQNIGGVLKPGGCVLLRDYAFGDFAQVKLKEKERMITENFYVRGDGTCSFYFTEDFLSNLFLGAGFFTADMSIYQKQIENHSRSITMDRYWIRGIFTKQNCGVPDSVLASK
ncbi:Methyltransferase-like protein [Psidium guajava]|nr:Methyltransferase-like protein [Psidium guajava]